MNSAPLTLIPEAISRVAASAPDHPVLRMAGVEVSYGDLDTKTNQFARMLLAHGIRKGDRVGLYSHKSLELFTALFGAMKAGAAYVPINPDAPAAYVRHIVEDCELRHLVMGKSTRKAAIAVAQDTSIETLVGDQGTDDDPATVTWDEVWAYPGEAPGVTIGGDDLAYIIFTSGSTGRPKGIVHTHRSGLAYGKVGAEAFGFRAADRIANHPPLNFDLSLLELWGGIVAGATIVVIPEAHARLPASLSQMLVDEQVTVINAVPFALVQLLRRGALEDRDLSGLRWVLYGGEVFPTKDLREMMRRLPHARFGNVYGPAETNGVTYHIIPELSDDDVEPVSIGELYPGTRALVLDDEDNDVGFGQIGEMVINSETHMVGYWRQPELTERVTYRRRLPDGTEERWHRTGDLVVRQEDGHFRFVGRKDRMVKSRGHRIELDEVEAVLISHPDVEQVVVYTVPDAEGSQQIMSVVVLHEHVDGSLGPSIAADIRRHAGRVLPRYAMPREVRIVESVPRTSTGKADRLALEAEAVQQTYG